MDRRSSPLGAWTVLSVLALAAPGCGSETTGSEGADESGTEAETTGDGDPSTGDGDGDPSTGDGDGDPSTGDGDPSTGDGDGDPSTGDGDGDPSTGDGDGDPSPVCGDGVVDGDEECDDGNQDDADACSSACTFSFCGDGIVHDALGEQCDDGVDNGPAANCYEDCTPNVCGDGVLGPMEGCDDGNAIDGDECTNACAFATCGDGVLGPNEQCDDGDDDDFDACTVTCVPSPAEPGALTLEITAIKQVELSWTAVYGATYYQILERAELDGEYVLVSDGIETESVSLTVPLHLRLNASYKLRACNPDGCTESAAADMSGNLAEAVGYFKASNTNTGDAFGFSVALSGDGNTLAVGASAEDSNAMGVGGNQADNSANVAGAVYVFARQGGVWSQQAYVKASNTNVDDQFGFSVALSDDGNTLAVGAPREDSSATGVGGNQADNAATDAGAVYVFVREGEAWSQAAYVKASNTNANDVFGESVALSGDGNTLAVGAWREDSGATGVGGNQADNSVSNAGAVYVFGRNGELWSQDAYLKASNTGGDADAFGISVALSGDGNTLAVGAEFEDSSATGVGGNQADNSALDAGAVYVFARAGGAWSQQAYVKASNTNANDRFGQRVTLSGDGNMLAVGARLEDSNATGVGGNQADNSANNGGAVYVFMREGGAWAQEAYVKASNTNATDAFGTSLALSDDGSTLAVGALGEDSNATGVGGNQADNSLFNPGAVYVFERGGGAWTQAAYVKASNISSGFGCDVALSADGATLAVGARIENSSATGIGGNQADNSAPGAGAVYLY